MEDVSKLIIDIEPRLTNLQKGLLTAEKSGLETAGRMEQLFQRAQLRFNDTLAKKSLTDIDQMVIKLRATLEKRMEMGAPVQQLNILKDSLNKAENAAAQFKKKAEEPVKESGIFGNLGEKIKSIGTQLLGVIAGIFAFSKLKQFASDSLEAFTSREEALLGVESTIKSMGKEAEYTVNGLLDMAKGLASINKNRFKVSDILDLQSFLLTLDTMNKDLLPKASQVVMDLAAKMKVDLVDAAKAVGIALEDPEGGLNRFRRSGIIFTEEQKTMIKTMVEAGDKAGAQAKIFEVLESKVGGFARNTTGAFTAMNNNLSVMFGAIERSIGTFIASALTPLGESLLAMVPKNAVDEFKKLSEAVKNTEQNILPLIGVYSTLKAKTDLTKEEHEKLHAAIQTMANAFPGAITQWDAYGNAIDISAGKLWELIKAEKERLKYTNREAIQKTYNDYANVNTDMQSLEFKLKKGTYTTGESDAPMAYSEQEKAQMNDALRKLGEQKKGIEAQYRFLTGELINTEPSKSKINTTTTPKSGNDILQQKLEAARALIASENKIAEEKISNDYQREKKAIEDKLALKLKEIEDEKKLATKEKPVSDKALEDKRKAARIEADAEMLKLNRELDQKKAKEAADNLKKMFEMEGKYAGEMKELEKQKYDRLIQNYDLSVEEYQQYLDKIRAMDVKAMERKNQEIKKYNMEMLPYIMLKMASPLQPIDIADFNNSRRQGDISSSDKYSEGKNDKELKQWEKENRNFAGVTKSAIGSITSEWTSALSEWITKGRTFTDATTHMWTNMANSIIEDLIKIGVQYTLLQGAKALVGDSTGGFGEFLIHALGGANGGTFSKGANGVQKMAGGGSVRVPIGYPNDSYLVRVQSDEDLHVTPSGQTRYNDMEQAIISRKLSALNGNIVDQTSEIKKQNKEPIPVVGKIGNDAIYLSGDRGGKVYRSLR